MSGRRRRALSLAERFARLDALGLRPIADPQLDAVHADCPHCHAGEGDPLRLWRPVTWGATGYYRCAACGKDGRV